MSHLETVKGIYAAFGRGDVPAILACLHENVDWEPDLAVPGVPWLQPRTGRDAVAGFFAALAPLQFTQFEPKSFLESGNLVVVLIDVAFNVTTTGGTVKEVDEVHIWRFDDAGMVTRFAHKVDSYQHSAAASGR